MGRKPIRSKNESRFSKGDRVAWKSGKAWKKGTVLTAFPSDDQELRQKALAEISPNYKLGKKRTTPSKKGNPKGFTYLVAEDSPLFQPGRTVCSVPENHLQDIKETWVFTEEAILKRFQENQGNPEQVGKTLALAVARRLHLKENIPLIIQNAFAREFPEASPKKKGNTNLIAPTSKTPNLNQPKTEKST